MRAEEWTLGKSIKEDGKTIIQKGDKVTVTFSPGTLYADKACGFNPKKHVIIWHHEFLWMVPKKYLGNKISTISNE